MVSTIENPNLKVANIKSAHHNHLLYFGNAFPKDGSQLISDTGQEESKQGNSQQGVYDTEDPASFGVRRNVSKSCKRMDEIDEKLSPQTPAHLLNFDPLS